MKKVTDFIGDCIVELMVASLVIIFPLATVTGMVLGFFDTLKMKIG